MAGDRLDPQRDLLAEVFARVENPHERAVLYGVFRLRRPLTNESLAAALVDLARVTPKLRATPRWIDGRLGWVDPIAAEELPARVILDPPPSDAEALAFPLAIDDGPVLRLALRSSNELLVLLHHSLSDWFGIRWLVTELCARAFGGTARVAIAPAAEMPKAGRTLAAIVRLLRRRSRIAAQHLPVLLGARHAREGLTKGQIRREVPAEDVAAMKEALRRMYPGATLNDWFVATLVRVTESWFDERRAQSFVPQGGTERISIYVPVDVRSYLGSPEPLFNAVSGGQVDTLPAHRADPRRLLDEVHRQMRIVRRPENLLAGHRLAAAALWVERHTSLRPLDTTTESWRHGCTSCLSNLGTIDSDEHVDAVFIAPPTSAPGGLMAAVVAVRGRLCIAFNYADYCVDAAEAGRIADAFVERLRDIG